MARLTYRVISACGALGCGFPRASLQAAIRGRVDAIVADAGSMDAGPYRPSAGRPGFERDAVKADFRHMVEAVQVCGAPLILGNCGTAGAGRDLAWMLEVAREVFAELGAANTTLAVIPADVDTDLGIAALRPIGCGPAFDPESRLDSVAIGRMGIHPLITALAGGARLIFAGRAFEAALFAADIVRHGIDPGLAYHVGHVLARGAQACDPASPSDCLIGEIHDGDSAVFEPASGERRCTAASLATRTLYGIAHPQRQPFPEGVLCTQRSEFFQVDERRAGLRGSRFLQLVDDAPLRSTPFPIRYCVADGAHWRDLGEERPRYFDIGLPASGDDLLDDRLVSQIVDAPPTSAPRGYRPLREMASMIRSTNAGIHRLSHDIVFASADDYELALASNLFHAARVSEWLRIEAARVVGSYYVDNCHAIKITIDRGPISAAADDRDDFVVQQRARLDALLVPQHPVGS